MKHLALAVLSAAEEVGPTIAFSKAVQEARKFSAKALLQREVGEATQERLTEKLFQRDYRGQTPVPQPRLGAANSQVFRYLAVSP